VYWRSFACRYCCLLLHDIQGSKQINVDELHFDGPVEVIGQGSLGVVLLAEYRGTKVAVKRAVKSGGEGSVKKLGSRKGSIKSVGDRSGSIGVVSEAASVEVISREGSISDESTGKTLDADPEAPERKAAALILENVSRQSSDRFDLGFLDEGNGKRNLWCGKTDYQSRFKESILGTSLSTHSKNRP